jgi:hypothetical protein
MKALKIMGNPLVVTGIFLLVLISGEQFGGFYLIYLLLGLPNGAPHAIIAVIGILFLVLGCTVHSKQYNKIKPLLCVMGDLIIIVALITFFKNSKGYNDATFHQAIPLLTFALLGIAIMSNMLVSTLALFKWNTRIDTSYRAAS